MPRQATPDQHPTTARPLNGGRACPLPVGLAAPCGPFGIRKPQRSSASTGVVTADLLERAHH